MVHTIPHDLDAALARQALDAAFAAYQERFARFGPTLRWEDDGSARFGFQVQGRALGGMVRLLPQAIELQIDMPLVLRAFAGTARRAIDVEANRWIERARSGAL